MLCVCRLFLHLLLTLEKFARLHDTDAFTFHCFLQVGLTLEEAAARRFGGTFILPLVIVGEIHFTEDRMMRRHSHFHDFCRWDSL